MKLQTDNIETIVREYMIGRLLAAIENGDIDEDKLLELVEENCKLLVKELVKEQP